MKILIYAINYVPELTGAAKYTSEMATWFAEQGHTVEVITGVPHYPEWEIYEGYRKKCFMREDVDSVRVMRTTLYVPKRVTSLGRILLEISFSFWTQRYWLPKLFGRAKYNLVIAICPPLQIGVWPWFYCRLRNVPWVFHIQDLQVDAAIRLQMLKSRFFGYLLYKIENSLLKKATRVSTITEAMCNRISEKGVSKENIWMVPNWSEIDFIRPLPRNNNFRDKLGITDDQVLFMYAGNMGQKQGLDLILMAAERLLGYSKIRFVMIGAGAVCHELKTKASDMGLENLSFLPVQPYDNLPEMLAAGDVHLVVQKREAADIVMPSKLTNILAAGRPALATADCGTTLHQVVEGCHAGLVTPPEELEPFIEGIFKLYDDADARTEMGKNGRAYAEKFLSKEAILGDFQNKLLNLLENHNKGVHI